MTRSASGPEPAGLLHSVLLKSGKALTCAVRTTTRRACDVCVVPHWDVSASIVERYPDPTSAFRRHAEIASGFRQAGWTLVRQTASRHTAAA